jgi:DNA repair protein SbcD/Mre11
MKLAVTADIHLTSRAEHPERFAALENMLDQMIATDLSVLIIAGDLFDASSRNYSEFEEVCKRKDYRAIEFLIIPGNHDPAISGTQIVAPNIHIFSKPEIVPINTDGPFFFFLPYQKNKTMGEFIAEKASQLPKDGWVLVAHGDWLDGLQDVNPYESGFYMPLTRKDLNVFQPAKAFLGHIHAPISREPVYYTGSPCGIDITETGLRRFLIFDTQTGRVDSRRVDSPLIYFDEALTILPLEDEAGYVRRKVIDIIRGWGIDPKDNSKIRLRFKANGFSADREQLLRTLEECFSGLTFYSGVGPDISAVSISVDPDRDVLAEAVRQQIAAQTWPTGQDEPTRDEILLAALEIIYGGK